ncbi:MAG: phosphoribosyltransferase [Armatimonadota bacterium]
MVFRDRVDAGKKLAQLLKQYIDTDTLIIAIPRGGVVVGHQISNELHLPMEIIVPRKIGAPMQPEFAIGAVAGSDTTIINDQAVQALGIPQSYIIEEAERQRQEIVRRELVYNAGRKRISPEGKTVILVDDGIATGYTMIASARVIRKMNPSRLIIAVPVAPPDSIEILNREAEEVVVVDTPEPFHAVGAWYEVFDQTTDEEVINLMKHQLGA